LLALSLRRPPLSHVRRELFICYSGLCLCNLGPALSALIRAFINAVIAVVAASSCAAAAVLAPAATVAPTPAEVTSCIHCTCGGAGGQCGVIGACAGVRIAKLMCANDFTVMLMSFR